MADLSPRDQAFAKVDLTTAELEMTGSIYDGFSTAIVVKGQPRTVGLFREFDDAAQVMALIDQARTTPVPDEGAAESSILKRMGKTGASYRAQTWIDAIHAAHPTFPPALDEGAAGERDNEPLKTDDTGCVTKRFVIFNRPGMAPEKKGGWLKDEYLIDFLREVMLLDCWAAGFRATVLELTWNNDLWASSASEYLSAHDHAIGPKRARQAWRRAREKHESIYRVAPSMPLGQEIASYHVRTAPSPTPAADADMARVAVEKLKSIRAMRSDRPSGPYPKSYKGGFDAAADMMSGWADEALAAIEGRST